MRDENIILLESIRAGVPTRNLISTLPDLRNDLIQLINKDLEQLSKGNSVKGRIIWGDYGQGKTHFLKVVEKLILEQGFAVSFLTLSRDLGLNKLDYLFPALASHVLTNETNIPGILNQLIDCRIPPDSMEELDKASRRIAHPLPWLIMQSLLSYERDLILLYNTLMGKKENIVRAKQIVKSNYPYDYQKMPKFNQKEHLKSFIEFFPYLLQSLKYKGWVILIDELEILGRLGSVSRLNSYLNLSWLMNLSEEHQLPIYTLAASAKTLQEDVFYGKKKHDAIDMPNLARERSGVQAEEIVRNLFAQSIGEQGLVLKPINPENYTPLLNKLLELHYSAIEWKYKIPDNLITETLKHLDPSNKPLRQVIRMFIETLDIFSEYGTYPEKFKENLLEEYDLDDELPEPQVSSTSQAGFTETSLKDMFDN